MYTVYERLWHWLQTAAIMALIFTGLIIHRPELFGLFDFGILQRALINPAQLAVTFGGRTN